MAALRPGELRARLINELWEVAQDAKEARDRRVVVSALAEISNLAGLKMTKVEVSTDPIAQLSHEQLTRLLQILEAEWVVGDDGVAGIEGEVV